MKQAHKIPGPGEVEIYKTWFNKYWGPINASVLGPPQKVEVSVACLDEQWLPLCGLSARSASWVQAVVHTAHPGPSSPWTRPWLTAAWVQAGLLGSSSRSVWLEHKVTSLFLLPFHLTVVWLDHINWHGSCPGGAEGVAPSSETVPYL